jgi:hypothetical protein
MKKNIVILLMVAGQVGGLVSGRAQTKDSKDSAAGSGAAGAPKIQFATPVFDFGKVNSGELVKHSFVFTNSGTATLQILDVRPGCGCTTAGTWDKEVEPGKTGSIPLQFNSANFGGMVVKSATVTCNDPAQSNVVLQIKGTVWKPIEISPTMAVFNVSSETQTNESRVVRIVNNLEEPLELSDLQSTNPTFKAEIKTVKPGKEFELHITASPPFNGPSIVSPVTMKTSSPKMSNINVTAYVVVQQPVTVVPNQIILQAGPLTNAVHHVVSVRSTATNALVLSDAAVSVPGAAVKIQEIQPGKQFNLNVDFPVGFQSQPGQKVEVTVKSNHPKFPVIIVPIYQPQAPRTAAANPVVSPAVRVQPIKVPTAAEK